MNFFYQTLKIVSVTVGAIIGAGFISGREVVSFFGEKTYIFPLILSFFLLALCLYLLYYLGSKNNGLISLNNKVIKTPKLFNCAVLIASFISSASILAGLDKVFLESTFLGRFPVLSIVFLVIISFTSAYGIGGVERVCAIVIPLLILTLFLLLLCSEKSFDFSVKKESVFSVKPFLYVSMNCFINLPAIVDVSCKKDRKTLMISAFISSIIIAVLSFLMLGIINKNNTSKMDIPLLYALNSSGCFLYTIILFFALITSLISAYYPLYIEVKKRYKTFGIILLAVFVFIFSRLGLKNIVDYVYPVIGGFGAVYILNALWFLIREKVNKKNCFDYNKDNLKRRKFMSKRKKKKVAKLTDEEYGKYIMSLKEEKPPQAVIDAQKKS